MTGSAAGTAKIAIAGAGHVWVTLAYACMIRGTGKTIALYARNAQKVRAEVLDLQHGLHSCPWPPWQAQTTSRCAKARTCWC